ncbi:MAG: sigma-70 family RNA polymerase sigma factor [Planctomycetaceae bacterium]
MSSFSADFEQTDEHDGLPTESFHLFRDGGLDIESVVQKYRPYLKALATEQLPLQLQSRLDDSDLVQEVLLRASREAEDFRGTSEAQLEAWLREILANCLKDNVRHNRRQMRDIRMEKRQILSVMAGSDPTPSEQIRRRESDNLIWQAVERLSEDHRTIILLKQQRGLSFVEIGERMQRSADAVRMLWSRALVALGEQLDGVD